MNSRGDRNLNMHVSEPGGRGGEEGAGNTHMFNKELCQFVLLLDTFFQFSQEKTKRRKGIKKKEATFFSTV